MEVKKDHAEEIEDNKGTQDNRTDYKSLSDGPW